jgi:hypothetical protein
MFVSKQIYYFYKEKENWKIIDNIDKNISPASLFGRDISTLCFDVCWFSCIIIKTSDAEMFWNIFCFAKMWNFLRKQELEFHQHKKLAQVWN